VRGLPRERRDGGTSPVPESARLRRGDSDLAVYKVMRDGIPQTGMAPIPMSSQQRWQVIGCLRTLHLASSNRHGQELPPADINVSAEQIRTAGSRADQWLTYSGSLDGRRYTPLAESTPENVARLRVRWIRQLGPRKESTPLIVGGLIFTTDPPSDVTVGSWPPVAGSCLERREDLFSQ
jgi:alcohol dehydrogenase (cytochrome c)